MKVMQQFENVEKYVTNNSAYVSSSPCHCHNWFNYYELWKIYPHAYCL